MNQTQRLLLIIVLSVMGVIAISILFDKCRERNTANVYQPGIDSLKKIRTADSVEIASSKAIIANQKAINAILSAKLDSSNKALKYALASKNASSVIYVNTTTTDTLYTNSVDTIYSIMDGLGHAYEGGDKWMRYNIEAYPDSIDIKYTVNNEYIIKSSWEKSGLFKKKYLGFSVTNLNPNTTTNEAMYYRVGEPKKRWNLSLGFGYGIGENFKPQPFIGLSLNRTLISF